MALSLLLSTAGATTQAESAAAAEDEASRGAAVFEARCASCHAIAPDAPPGPGPNLGGLGGRRIGSDPGFDYSPVMAEAEGVWDTERLDLFLADPEEMFPGLWMGDNGIRDPEDRAAVVRFLMDPRASGG